MGAVRSVAEENGCSRAPLILFFVLAAASERASDEPDGPTDQPGVHRQHEG